MRFPEQELNDVQDSLCSGRRQSLGWSAKTERKREQGERISEHCRTAEAIYADFYENVYESEV
jgi:hypothetical protein